MEIKCAYTEIVDTDSLVPNPRNPNKHSQEQVEYMAKVIERHGWRQPIVVSKRSGFMTKGHGRLMAAKLKGWKKLPIDRQDYKHEAEEYQDMTADNELARLAELDRNQLIEDVKSIPGIDLEMLGIPDFKLPDTEPPQGDPDDMPEKVEPRSKLGDLYQLGRHRLLCGDSTNIQHVERLMGGEKADLWITDPPYGVSYGDKNRFLNALAKGNAVQKPIENDHKSIEEMHTFWRDVATTAYAVTTDKCSYYWFACQGGDQMMMMMMSISEANWKVRHELIWVKNNHVLGRCDYHYKHEPILYGWKKDGTHEFHGDSSHFSVLNFDKPTQSKLHPTMKPVELVEYLMGNNSKTGQAVLDTFGGSGTTMIAAEKAGRRSFLVEIDPSYCNVIVARWEKFTGKKAELINE